MTQEEKQLLLKDLCARLPYEVNIQVKEGITVDTELKIGHIQRLQNDEIGLKPYLRPMSSMTEEEVFEFIQISDSILRIGEKKWTCILSLEQMDWLNAHHFDYRGLIEKGLALEAPKDMYKTE